MTPDYSLLPCRGKRQWLLESSRFLKKAAQKLLLCWAMGCVSDNAHAPA
jgi:hypothetical protein